MKNFLLKTWLILVCLLTGAGTMWGAALGTGYTKITDITSLSAGDAVVLYCDNSSSGVTGYSGSDATVSTTASDWIQFVVEKNGSNYYLKNPADNKYITKQTSNKFTITATTASGNEVTVDKNGVLCINSRYLVKNGSYYRMYSSVGSYQGVFVYKVLGGSTSTTYNVTISNNIANGYVTASATSATAGTEVTLTATPATGYEFGSWNVTNASTSAAITVANNKFTMPAANVNVSATFNAIQGGGGEEPSGDNTTVTWTASEQGYTNGTQYTSATVDENISLAFGDGGNDGKYYTTGSGIRLYANGKMTVSAANGGLISRIVITYDSGNTGTFSANTGEYSLSSATGTWTGSASSVVLTNTASTGHARIQKIAVTYTTEGGETPEPEKITPALSFTSTTATAYLDALNLFVAPTLTADPENLTGVTYSMSGDNVGTINASTGVLTLNAAGTATITASYAGDGVNYEAAEDAIYTLTVNETVPEKSIAEFVASEGGICYLTGIVSNIATNNYGNFDLTDETGTIYVYGCLTPEGEKQKFNTLGVVAGDKIKVLADEYTVFNEKNEAVNVIFVEEIEIKKTQYTVTIETPANGTLVVKEGENFLASGAQVEEGKTLTIECTPANEDYRLKNWQAVDGSTHTFTTTFTYDVTADVTIKATFELIPVYTVAFSVNGAIVQSDNLKEGATVTAYKDPKAINGKVFTGWIETATVEGDTPAYVTPSATATKTVTYYAVFATQTGAGGASQKNEITYNTENIPTSYADAADIVLNGMTFNVTQMYKNGEKMQWRAAGNKAGTGVMYNKTAIDHILSIAITYTDDDANKNFTVKVGSSENPTSGTEIDAAQDGETSTYIYDCSSAAPSYFVLTNGTGAGYLSSIVITYGGGSSYSDFTTTVSAPEPESEYGEINFVAVGDDGYGYATFCNTKDVVISVDDVFYVAAVSASNNKLTILELDESNYCKVSANEEYVASETSYVGNGYASRFYYIPANTGVLLQSTPETTIKYFYVVEDAHNQVEEFPSYVNMLRPASVEKETDGSYLFYKLAYGVWTNESKSKLGFWWGAADGGVFESKVGGVYLAVPAPAEGASNMRGFSFEPEERPTGIESVSNEIVAGEIYNLQGQRINRLQQGVNIVNGRKVIR